MESSAFKKHTLVADNHDHFVIQDGKGNEFKVAKSQTDPFVHKKITSLERHENFACGGMVKGYADGGVVEPGNIDLKNRPRHKNPDGSISTVRSIGVNVDGKEVLLPTVSDSGGNWTTNEAVDNYKKTGKHLGVFDSPESSTAYAKNLHEDQAKQLDSNTSSEVYVPENLKVGSGDNFDWLTKQYGSSPSGEAVAKYGSVDEAMKAEKFYKEKGQADPYAVSKGPSPTTDAAPAAATPAVDTGITAPKAEPTTMGPPAQTQEQKLAGSAADTVSAADAYVKSMEDTSRSVSKRWLDASNKMAQRQVEFTKDTDALNAENKALHDDILSQKINPNRVWENTSASGKILASIGVILGGIGANGGKNLALESIQKTIDSDIDAQKANLNNKQSLLSKNLEKYRNMRVAEEVTRNQLMSATTAQVSALEAQNIGPRAKLEAQKFKMEMQSMVTAKNLEIAKYRSAERMAAGEGTTQDVVAGGEKVAETAVKIPGSDGYASAKSPAIAAKLNDTMANSQNAIDIIKKIEKAGPAYGMASSEEANADVARLESALTAIYGKEGNLRENALKIMREMIESPTGTKNRLGLGSDKKMGQLIADIENRRDNELSAGLINYKKPAKPRTAN